MARVACKMQSLGNPKEKCEECNRKFERGEQMTAVEYNTGDPAGWYCDACIENWNEKWKK